MGRPHFQNVRLKLNAALDCEAAHSVVTGISHWYQVIRQAAKFFHLLCGFERSSASPFGCAITSTPTETTRAEHVCATRSVLPVIVDDLPSQGFTSVRAIAVELNERSILTAAWWRVASNVSRSAAVALAGAMRRFATVENGMAMSYALSFRERGDENLSCSTTQMSSLTRAFGSNSMKRNGSIR
jgi:hypothetical protein